MLDKVALRVASLRENAFFRSVTSISLGSFAGTVVAFVCLPIISRLYPVESFGVNAVFLGLLAPLIAVSSLRYEMAIPMARDEKESTALVYLSMAIVLGFVGLTSVAALTIGEWVTQLILGFSLGWKLWLIPVGVAVGGGYQVFSYLAIRDEAYRAIGRTKLFQASGLVSVQIGAGWLGAGYVGLILGEVVGRSAGLGTLLKAGGMRVFQRGLVGWTDFSAAARTHRSYAFFSAPSALMSILAVQILPLAYVTLFGTDVGGQFALAYNALIVPALVLGKAVASVFLKTVSEAALHRQSEMLGIYRRTLVGMLRVGALPFAVAISSSWVLFPIVFGSNWGLAGQMASVYGLATLAQFAVSPLTHAIIVLGKQSVHLAWDAARIVLLVGSIGAAGAFSLSPIWTTFMVSVTVTLSYAAHIVISLVILRGLK